MRRNDRLELRSSFLQMAHRGRRIRTAEAAQALGVTELDLLDTFPEYVRPLRADFHGLFQALGHLGVLLGLTRNQYAVIECQGEYRPYAYSGHAALVLGDAIDLRLALRRFAFARFVSTPNLLRLPGGVMFFDAWGCALHKVFFTSETPGAAQQELLEEFGTSETEHVQTAYPGASIQPTASEAPASPVDAEALRRAWAGMRDTHDIFGLLRRFRLSRLQALHRLGPSWAVPAKPEALWELLQAVASSELPIMVFVGNRAVTQIYKGRIGRTAVAGDWWNVLDAKFNLHVQRSALGQSWVVRKPVPEGHVTSLEVFDRDGDLLVQVFSYRRPGTEESAEWRATLDRIAAR
ncbi:MAG: hemin-degrading factor [Candidatus Binatia bacterium]|nr:MAG: hemin-degrading factor [Candidatus Binatia bacterium]